MTLFESKNAINAPITIYKKAVKLWNYIFLKVVFNVRLYEMYALIRSLNIFIKILGRMLFKSYKKSEASLGNFIVILV